MSILCLQHAEMTLSIVSELDLCLQPSKWLEPVQARSCAMDAFPSHPAGIPSHLSILRGRIKLDLRTKAKAKQLESEGACRSSVRTATEFGMGCEMERNRCPKAPKRSLKCKLINMSNMECQTLHGTGRWSLKPTPEEWRQYETLHFV